MVGLKWKTWIASVLVAATCFVTTPAVHADGRSTTHVANQIKDVTFKEATGITQIRVKGTQAGAFSVYRLERPTRVVVDVAQAQLSEAVRGAHESSVTYTPGTWGVSQIAAQTLDDGGSAVRVIVTLARPGQYDVKADGDDIVVTVTPRDAAPAVIGTAEIAHARADAEAARNESKEAQKARATAEATAQKATAEATDAQATAADAKAAASEAKAAASQAKSQALSAQAEAERLRDEAKKQSKRAEQAEADAKAARASASSSNDSSKQSAAAKAEDKAKMEKLIAAARAEAEAAKTAAANAQAEADRTRAVAKTAEETARREAKALKDAAAADRKAAEENRDAAEQARASAMAARKAADKTLKDAAEREASAKKVEAKAERERAQAQEAAAQAMAARDAAAANDSADHHKLDVAARAAERRLKDAEAATQSAETKRHAAEQDAMNARNSIEAARSQLAALQEQRAAAERAADEARAERKREEKATAQAEHARELAEAASKELHERMAAQQQAADELAAKSKAAAAARDELASADQKTSDKRELERNQKEAKRLEAERLAAQRDLSARKKAVEEKQAQVAQLVATREKAAADLARLQTEAADAKAAASSAIAEANDAKAQAQSAKAEASNAKAEASSAMAQAKSATSELNDAKAQAKNATAEAERAKAAAREATAQLNDAKAQAKSATAEADRAKASAAVAAAQANEAKAKADDARAQRMVEEKRIALLAAQQATHASQTAVVAATSKPVVATPAPVIAAPAPVATKAVAPVASLIAIRDVSFTGDADQGDVAISLNGDAAAKLVSTTATRAEIIIEGAELPTKLERKLDVSHFGSQVSAISSFRDRDSAGRVHLIVDLNSAMTPSIERSGNTLHLKFAGQTVAARHAAQTQNVPSPVMGAFRATTATTPAQASTAMQAPSSRKTYHGATVDLDFKDAPIHDLLRLLSDVGRVNIVIPDDIKAAVTVRMKRVPWDQALEVILASKGLWYRRDGNLYRVAPRKELDAEDEAEAARRASMVQAEAPTAEILTLNYSDAADLAKKLDPMLSPKGKIAVDARTNALIVNDIAGNRRAISQLALKLDTQTPQISIEARVVEAQSTFKREIGIQWGGHASASQLTGNSTGLVFPNAVGLTGGATDATTPGAGVATPSDFAVNLPAAVGTGEGGALGVTLGSIGGNFNINLRLSALEDSGTVRIISAPKITVLNNVEAKISQGTAIPISVVAATGTQTQFVNADLSLTVKPYVSQRDCSIAMDVTVTKDEPDFVNKGARGDPTILRKQVHTKMLVADGETTVMGGIYTRNTGLSYTKVPFLGDLPVIGWLFKHRTENDTRTEVLVFLTPKITNKAFLRCQ